MALLVLALSILNASLSPAQSPASLSRTESIAFSTRNQSLWGPRGATRTKSFRVEVIDELIGGSEGEIRRIDYPIDNAEAVQAWEEAVSQCDARQYCYDFPVVGRRCFSPSRQQCIDGYDVTYPCPTFTNPLKTCTFHVNGSGPKPSGTIDRPFDIGALIEWQAGLVWGVSGGITLDEGSVDVDFPSAVTLEVEGSLAPGEVFTLSTSLAAGEVRLRSRWPSIDGYIDTFLDAGALCRARCAGVNTRTGEQIDESVNFLSQDTGGEFHKEILGFRIGSQGLELRVLEEPYTFLEEGFEYRAALPILADPTGQVKISVPILDVGLFTPILDTPAPPSFDGDYSNGIFDGSGISNWLAPGKRDLFDWGEIDNGILDTDAARLDFDIDAITAFAWGTPLGLRAQLGQVPPFFTLFDLEGNFFDLDAVLFLGFRKFIRFEPRLLVELSFNQPVQVETAPGSGVFETATSKRLRVGEAIRIIHPDSDLEIQPVYSLEENLFHNDSDLILSPAIQGTLLQLQIGGLILSQAADFLGLPSNMALGQITVDLKREPWVLADLNFIDDADAAEFSLQGFETVRGEALRILPGAAGRFIRGDCNGDGGTEGVTDALAMLTANFIGGIDVPCRAACDANGDGDSTGVTDALLLLTKNFLGGVNIPLPYPGCGPLSRPGDAALGCERESAGCR